MLLRRKYMWIHGSLLWALISNYPYDKISIKFALELAIPFEMELRRFPHGHMVTRRS